jgi:RNA polymerase sigma factor for flagellar operon FliA
MECYLPLVTRTVNQMSARLYHRVDPPDLLGVAIMGLYRSIECFSERHGVPFEAYARHRIKGAILDEARRRDPLTRSQRTRLNRIQAEIDRFIQHHSRAPSEEEIAENLDLSPEEVTRIMALECHTISIHERTADGLTYEEMIPDRTTPSPADSADRQSALQALRQAIPKLDVREQQLLYFRHSQALTIAEIAAVFEVTPGRVSQIYNGAICRLRSLMKVNTDAGACSRADAETEVRMQ